MANSAISKKKCVKSAEQCVIYWDYENCPIPSDHTVKETKTAIQKKIYKLRGRRIPLTIKCYIPEDNHKLVITKKILRDMDLNGIKVYHIPSQKPEAVDKRMLVDIAWDLYERKGHTRDSIAVVSGDKDFSHLLSRLENVPEIYMSVLFIIDPEQNVNPELLQSVDHVVHGLFVEGGHSELDEKNDLLKPCAINTQLYQSKPLWIPMSLQYILSRERCSIKVDISKVRFYEYFMEEVVCAAEGRVVILSATATTYTLFFLSNRNRIRNLIVSAIFIRNPDPWTICYQDVYGTCFFIRHEDSKMIHKIMKVFK